MSKSGEKLSKNELDMYDPEANKRGRNWRYLCPLPMCCEKRGANHRSISVDSQSGLWNCKRCGAAGKLAEYKNNLLENRGSHSPSLNQSRRRAKREIRRSFNTLSSRTDAPRSDELSRHFELADRVRGTDGERYLLSRGIDISIATDSNVLFSENFYGRAAVLFPICNSSGELVAVNGRYVNCGDGQAAPELKTRSCGRKSEGLFLTKDSLTQNDEASAIIITESPLDALSVATCGYPAVATCGCGSWPEWLISACRFHRVFVAFDNDVAGDDSAIKLSDVLAPWGARVERLKPLTKDWNEALCRYGAASLRGALQQVLEENLANKDSEEQLRQNRASEADTQFESFNLEKYNDLLAAAKNNLLPVDVSQCVLNIQTDLLVLSERSKGRSLTDKEKKRAEDLALALKGIAKYNRRNLRI